MTTRLFTDAGISNPYSSQYTFTVLLSMMPVTLPSSLSDINRTMSPILIFMSSSVLLLGKNSVFFI